jgi:hypothetical protein
MAALHLRAGARVTQKPKTFSGDLAHLPQSLLPLTQQRRWVVWPWELRKSKNGKEKWTKPPRLTRDPAYSARSNDPDTWGSYDEAVAAVAAGDADGIGYMLLGSGIGAIDLDHVVAEDGTLRWAEQLQTEAAAAYQERTVSGTGLRIIGKATGPDTHRKFIFDRKTNAGIELYRNAARYIAVSGLEVGNCVALPSIDDLIDTLLARHSGGPTRAEDDTLDFNATERQKLFDYDALIRNGAPEGERSEAFAAVVWHLAGQGWSAEQIAEELAKHPGGVGAKYADRLLTEVNRCFEKWRAQSAAPLGATHQRVSGHRFSSLRVSCLASSTRPRRRCLAPAARCTSAAASWCGPSFC